MNATEIPASDKLTVAVLGAQAFNTDLAKKLQGLKRSIGATKVLQGYKGTGSKSHRRQIWVDAPGLSRGGPDLWLEATRIDLGGIITCGARSVAYGELTVDEVYQKVVEALTAVQKID